MDTYLYWQVCPKCGHKSTPDCEGHKCHNCGSARYSNGDVYDVIDVQVKETVSNIEEVHKLNKTRSGQAYMDYVGHDYEFLLQLVHEQEEQIKLYRKLYEALHDKNAYIAKFDECVENDDVEGQAIMLTYINHYDDKLCEILKLIETDES